jgi:molybdopterin synthase catalytic subunit
MSFLLTEDPFDPAIYRRALQNIEAGGYCTFEGWVRKTHLGKEVEYLVYESYASLAHKQGERVVQQALEKYDILDAHVIHRTGKLKPGDLAVWIGVTAAHRSDAFEACRYLIDTVKETVPIWKHEFYSDGTDVWVDPTDCHCAAEEPSEE